MLGRGSSGALYLQSAKAGANRQFEGYICMAGGLHTVLRAGSFAIKTREPRQVGNEAAISEPFYVTKERLA